MSRRERLRDSTREEIKALARQQMASQGTAALSLGAIARAMEVVPSALYRYFASRDELITALVIDAYDALADAVIAGVAAQAPDDYVGRLLYGGLAYRAWALAHPADFLLIFGNPIPGYTAPSEQTVLSARRTFSVFFESFQASYAAGQLRLPQPAAELAAVVGEGMPFGPDAAISQVSPAVAYVAMASWAKLHGMVMLELTHHLIMHDNGAFARSELLAEFARLGLTQNNTS